MTLIFFPEATGNLAQGQRERGSGVTPNLCDTHGQPSLPPPAGRHNPFRPAVRGKQACHVSLLVLLITACCIGVV